MPVNRIRTSCLGATGRFLVGILGLLFLAGCADDHGGHPNLVVVVVDTLRQDHLSIYGHAVHPTSPEWERLAAEGVKVEGLTGVSSWTAPSLATLFTGLPPSGHGIKRIFQILREPVTLASSLRNAGYLTACIMANFILTREFALQTPQGLKAFPSGYSAGFDVYDDTIARKPEPHAGSTAADVTRRGLAWLAGQDADEPWFLALHYFDPHVVYEHHPGIGFADPDYRGPVRPGMPRKELQLIQDRCSPVDRAQLAAYYDEEVRAVDNALAALFAELRKRPDWENTVVLLTSDHGEELSERGYIGHTVTLHHELVDLPLVVLLPEGRQAGTERKVRLSQADLFATILDLCGVPVPAGRGASFAGILTGASPPADADCYSEVDFVPANRQFEKKFTKKRAVLSAGFKLVHDLKNDSWHLYDLKADPGESANLAADPEHRDTLERLRSLQRAHPWLK